MKFGASGTSVILSLALMQSLVGSSLHEILFSATVVVLSASVTENRPPSKRATEIKILDSSHCLCSDSSMCIDNKYHESLARFGYR